MSKPYKLVFIGKVKEGVTYQKGVQNLEIDVEMDYRGIYDEVTKTFKPKGNKVYKFEFEQHGATEKFQGLNLNPSLGSEKKDNGTTLSYHYAKGMYKPVAEPTFGYTVKVMEDDSVTDAGLFRRGYWRVYIYDTGRRSPYLKSEV